MKKLLACILTVVLVLTCFTACDKYEGTVDWELSQANGDTCAVFQFEDFCGKMTVNLDRQSAGEGTFYCSARLFSGAMSVSYYDGLLFGKQPLFTAYSGMAFDSSAGYIERDGTFPITFTSETPVTGEIIISFVPFYAGLPFGLEDPTKGIEVYCFKNQLYNEWRCYALPGTNEKKPFSDILSLQTTSLENMRQVLKNLGLTDCATIYYISISCEGYDIKDRDRYADDYAYLHTALGVD